MTSQLKIIIITGTPGVGKTSISNFLKSRGYSVINLNEIILQNGFYFGYDFTRGSVIVDEEIIKSKFPFLISSNTKPIFVEGHITELIPKELVEAIFIIRCNPKELKMRLLSRGYSNSKVKENIQAEIMEECRNIVLANYQNKKIFEIDSTRKSIESIATQIIKECEIMFQSTY